MSIYIAGQTCWYEFILLIYKIIIYVSVDARLMAVYYNTIIIMATI